MKLNDLYFSFNGRIDRQTYWIYGVLALFGVSLLALLLDLLFGANGGFLSFVQILVLWPALAIQAKRWHDRDKSGWWSLIILIPFVGAIWTFVELGFLEGTRGPNQYGSAPSGIPINMPSPSQSTVRSNPSMPSFAPPNHSLPTVSSNPSTPSLSSLNTTATGNTQGTMTERLAEVNRLKEQGLLSETEYNDARRKILGLS